MNTFTPYDEYFEIIVSTASLQTQKEAAVKHIGMAFFIFYDKDTASNSILFHKPTINTDPN